MIQHAHLGTGRIVGYEGEFCIIHFKGDVRDVPFSYQEIRALETTEDPELQRVKLAVQQVLGDYGWTDTNLEVHKRWIGGTLKLMPGTEDTQSEYVRRSVCLRRR
jgi:hypothetical protein